MEVFKSVVNWLSDFVWGLPMIIVILLTGIFLSIRTKFVQIRLFKHAIGLISGKFDRPEHEGHITHFQALSTALSATIGTGNIAGVATAIYAGGPGAVFWMWISALFGMAVKFTSATLAVKYRKVTKDSVKGGPMYYIEMGIKERYGWNFKWLAVFFALSTAIAAFGIGNTVQANSVADALSRLISGANASAHTLFYVKLAIGLVLAALTGLVIIGGIKRIAQVASRLTPTMSVFYVLGALTILVINYDKLLDAFKLIFTEAFTGHAARGAILGTAVLYVMRMGFARGIFSNEAGLGTAPMAHSAARTNLPAREGIVAMLGPFIDTIVICTMTALVIIVAGFYSTGELNGAALTAKSFQLGIGNVGSWIVNLGLALFAYSTLIGWYFYGEKGIEYLFDSPKVIFWYKILWVVLIPIGAVASLGIVWNISDVFNGFMALPNLVALFLLSGVAVRELKAYLSNPDNFKPVK